MSGNAFSAGGNVTINSINLLTLNQSRISAQATQGKGGNIQVNAEAFLHDAANVSEVVNASSQVTGNDGSVAINAPDTDLSASLMGLPDNYLDASAPLSRRCGTGDPDSRSRFIVRGQGGARRQANSGEGRCGP